MLMLALKVFEVFQPSAELSRHHDQTSLIESAYPQNTGRARFFDCLSLKVE